MKKQNLIAQTLLLIACTVIVTGCQTNRSQYVIHDRVENDYWTGTNWWTREHAKSMPKGEAIRTLSKMRRDEVGGYANVGPESERPIVLQPIN